MSTPVPRWVLVVPVLWSLIGGSAAFLLAIAQDWVLLFSGLSVLGIVLRERRMARGPVPPLAAIQRKP